MYSSDMLAPKNLLILLSHTLCVVADLRSQTRFYGILLTLKSKLKSIVGLLRLDYGVYTSSTLDMIYKEQRV